MIPSLVLTLKQPWAWAVFESWKDIENRTWATNVTGPVLFSSSAQVTAAEYDAASEYIERLTGVAPPPKEDLLHGYILGKVSIGECLEPEAKPTRPWRQPNCYGFTLYNKCKIATPIPCKGLQRFWKVGRDPQLLSELGRAVFL